VSFMGGTTGIFFKQFGLTMAVAVGISFINALTLAPALCALLLKPTGNEGSFTKKVTKVYDTAFHALLGHYLNGLKHIFKRKKLVALSVVAALALVVLLFKIIPTGFVPNEDVGTLFVEITAPSGYTMEKTRGIMDRTCEQIQQLPAVESVGGVVGVGSGSNGASIFVQLKPWKQRRRLANRSPKRSDCIPTRLMETCLSHLMPICKPSSFTTSQVVWFVTFRYVVLNWMSKI